MPDRLVPAASSGVPSAAARPDAYPWAALEIYAVIVLIGGAFAAPLLLPLLGGLLVQFSRRWTLPARLAVGAGVVAPLGLLPVSVLGAAVAQSALSVAGGLLLARTLRRRAV